MSAEKLSKMSTRELQNYRARIARFREETINAAMQHDTVPEDLNKRINELSNTLYDIDAMIQGKG